MKTTKTKTTLFDSIRTRQAAAKAAKLAKATPKADPVKAEAKPATLAQPDATPVLKLTAAERVPGKTFAQILADRRRRGEDVPNVFRLAAFPPDICTIHGGAVLEIGGALDE